jgi:hypothetical protein
MGREATATEQGSQYVLNLQVFFLIQWRMGCVFVRVCCRCEMQGLAVFGMEITSAVFNELQTARLLRSSIKTWF